MPSKKTSKKLSEIIPEIREHVVMRDFNTWGVGGVADYFVEVFKVEDLIRIIRLVIKEKIPYFILGNGSNILFSDFGFAGIVIKNSTSNITVMKEKSQVIADSGAQIANIILQATTNNLTGIEFLYGVPGTIGGAVYGNAGAFGSAIGDYIKNITVLEIDPEDELPKIQQHDRKWLSFDYRISKLKKIKSKFKPVILTVRLQLSQNQKAEIMRRLNECLKKRLSSQPVGRTAGSVFKNPIPKELKNISSIGTKGMPELPEQRRAGFLLDQAGAKKLQVGGAQVSLKHANFIINKNNAKAADIRTLIEEMREKVRQKYEITLEEEIEYVGQW